MFTGSLDYNVCSTDPKHYYRINCNITAPITKYAKMVVTCLTANCDIVVLEEDDYISITENNSTSKYIIKNAYKGLDQDSFATLLSTNILKTIQHVYLNESGRLVIAHNHQFTIEDMSYNFKLISGYYNSTFPIKAEYDSDIMLYTCTAESVGLALSTPILYLTSNIGMQSYRTGRVTDETDLYGAKIVMRLNNAFSSSCPIVVNNADFETTILSNDLSCLEFKLVDGNMHELHMLSPLYLSIHVQSIPDEEIPSMFEIVNGLKK